ncbi:hypothetical protein EEJ42_28625 [Streptomyces botrytidirepellens]|uniref:Uncharacterized protein n=1 Tax=Streptomyces botrytidirepellens TaxID=2486417 RepID=A0A3M8VND9_9ACTN|nr:hypothetical protein [Streptomyces botrytidirepellens]RNG17955.1 hypothetical protein EEJ42_28625 [Streptomyces botrytidirepellens]
MGDTVHTAPQQSMPQPVPPQPRRSWFARHKVLTAIGALIGVCVIGGIASGGGKDGEDSGGSGGSDTAASAPRTKTEPEQADAKSADRSQAREFADFVTKNGTPTEKAAVEHVTKVQGADEQNDVLDSAEVWTDYTGGMMGPHASDGKLIASAFADWKNSENGLVTVYDAEGEILSNGNF